jgi:AcrR family transcriptional regulator
MARRSDHSRDEIREMALVAAEQLVSELGFEGLSARKVANSIGYTVGTLYLIFENLDDLILHINARTLDRLHRRMEEAQTSCSNPGHCLQQLGQTYIDFAKANSHLWEMVFKHRLPEGQHVPTWFQDKVHRMFAMVEAQLIPLAKNRSQAEIAQAAGALWGGVHGICMLALTGKIGVAGVDSIQDLTESLMNNYLKGFTALNKCSNAH